MVSETHSKRGYHVNCGGKVIEYTPIDPRIKGSIYCNACGCESFLLTDITLYPPENDKHLMESEAGDE
jgi:hypothetical protein